MSEDNKPVTLKPKSNDALQGKKLPKKLKVLDWGHNATPGGSVKVGDNTVNSLPSVQSKTGFDRVALDFNHNSLPGHDNYQDDPREVAGYGEPLVVPGDGVYLDNIEYTPTGESHAANYSHVSPAVLLDDNGEVGFLHSVALCPPGNDEAASNSAQTPQSFSAKIGAVNRLLALSGHLNEAQEHVCKMLGLSQDDWRRYNADDGAQVSALAAVKPGKAPTAADAVRKALGISKEDWDRYS